MRINILLLLICVLGVGRVMAQGTQAVREADSLFDAKKYTAAINVYAAQTDLYSQQRIAEAYHALGNYGKAIDQYGFLVTKYPHNTALKRELASLLYKTRDYKNTIVVYDSILLSDSLNPDLYYRRGLAYKAMSVDSLAQHSFLEAFRLDTNHVKSIVELGEYHLKRRQLKKAHEFADKGLIIAPDHAELLNIKALAWFNDYQFELARPYFEKLVELNYREDYLLLRLARCYEKTWEKDKAVRIYKLIVAIDPGNSDAFYELGSLYRHKKDLDSAQYYFKEAYITKKPDLSRELVALASIHREKGEVARAFELYKQAHEEAPGNMLIYMNVCELAAKYYADSNRVRPYYERFRELYSDKKYAHIYLDKINSYLRETEE